MADISKYAQLPTVQAIYAKYEELRDSPHRRHLGASGIGHPCDRLLWYQFRWCDHQKIEGRVLRLFNHGDVEEQRLVKDLRAIGCEVYSVDPETGQQFNFSAFGGHLGCSLDGVGRGLYESAKWHLLEFKTSNAKRFAQLKKDGLKKWSSQYWAQVILGMELADLERTLHLTTNKDTDEIYGERINADPKEAQRLMNRAERVIFSESPLERISNRPDWYQCKFCPMHSVCHGQKVAEVNCRTCVHSTPQRDGTWHCDRHDKTLSTEAQRKGCDRHLMRPDLVPYAETIEAGDDWIKYDNGLVNHCDGAKAGQHCYTSEEMRHSDAPLPLPDEAETARQTFGATVKKHSEPA